MTGERATTTMRIEATIRATATGLRIEPHPLGSDAPEWAVQPDPWEIPWGGLYRPGSSLGGWVLCRARRGPVFVRISGGEIASANAGGPGIRRTPAEIEAGETVLIGEVLLATSAGSAKRGICHRLRPVPADPIRRALRLAHLPGDLLVEEAPEGPLWSALPIGGDLCHHSTAQEQRSYTVLTDGDLRVAELDDRRPDATDPGAPVLEWASPAASVWVPVRPETDRYCPRGCDLSFAYGAIAPGSATWAVLGRTALGFTGFTHRPSVVRVAIRPGAAYADRVACGEALATWLRLGAP